MVWEAFERIHRFGSVTLTTYSSTMEETENSCQETSGSNDIKMETDGATDPSFRDIQTVEILSPNTLNLKLKFLKRTEASLVQDEKGRTIIQDEQKSKVFWDASKANTISECEPDDVKIKVESCFELIDYFKTTKLLSGVVFDKTKVHQHYGRYREGYEFEKTKKVLGSGIMAGNIVVIKDKATGMELAQKTMYDCTDYLFLHGKHVVCSTELNKTVALPESIQIIKLYQAVCTEHVILAYCWFLHTFMTNEILDITRVSLYDIKEIMISVFRKEEIKAWIDLAETGFPPALYLFKVEGNKVEIYMEILSEAKTLRAIIDEFRMDTSLAKPFSLYVLDGMLRATRAIHDKGWVHRDLHAGNIMMQKHSESKLRIRILDFGMAQYFDGSQGLQFEAFQGDIKQVVRIFSALYCGQEFDSARDLQDNWQRKINEVNLADEDKRELFCLIEGAMQILLPSEVPKFHELVQNKLQSALPDAQSHDDMMRRVLAILFPDIKDFRAIHDHQKEDSLPESCPPDVADSVVRKPPHSTSVKHHDVADSRVPAFSTQTDPIIPDEILKNIRLSLSIKPHDKE